MIRVADLASFLLVDRIYHAGRERLFSIGWFATVMTWLTALRAAILAPIRRSATYQKAVETGRRIMVLLRLRLGRSSKQEGT